MESHKRTEMVNRLTEEAHLMMTALEKAMEGERLEESYAARRGTSHPHGAYSLEDEHKSWGKILKFLTEIQLELRQIEEAEQRRLERVTPGT